MRRRVLVRRSSAAASGCAGRPRVHGDTGKLRRGPPRGAPAAYPRTTPAWRMRQRAGRGGFRRHRSPQTGEVVDGRGHAGKQLVRQGAELEPLRHVVGRGQQLVRPQRPEQRRARRRARRVRAEELVRRAGEEVRAERGNVDGGVRGEVHAVDVDERAGLVGAGGDLGDAGRVPIRLDAAVIATSRVRSPITPAMLGAGQLAVVGVEVDPPHRCAGRSAA